MSLSVQIPSWAGKQKGGPGTSPRMPFRTKGRPGPSERGQRAAPQDQRLFKGSVQSQRSWAQVRSYRIEETSTVLRSGGRGPREVRSSVFSGRTDGPEPGRAES